MSLRMWIWSLKKRVGRLPAVATVRRRLQPESIKPSEYHKAVLSESAGNDLIRSRLASGGPLAVERIGGQELACLNHYLYRRRGFRQPLPYPRPVVELITNNAGVFPDTEDALDHFCEEALEALTHADVLGLTFQRYQNRVIREYCPRAELIPATSIEPYYHTDPWSAALRGRRVLVVHPCSETIREQYEGRRERLFDDRDMLPPFELQVIKAVQSIAGEPTDFESWSEALDSMKQAMDATVYDVCIVGAGAYGGPLTAHAKKSGKQGIHMAGATQVLFGIKGRRWDHIEAISKLYNDSWVRPRASEVPRNSMTVEGGCYW